MTDCIGLDIGSTAIKAVRFRRGLSGRESVEYFHQKLPFAGAGATDQGRVVELLRAFVRRHRLGSALVVTALACRELFLRTLTLPFDDAEKVAQVAPFEMENLIPLPLEEVAVGCVLLGGGAEGRGKAAAKSASSDVLVAAAPRATVTEHLKLLADVGIDPAVVHVDGLALFAVTQQLRREGAKVPQNLAIIDLGATKTTLCLTHQGRPWTLRTIPWGGDRVTEGLIQDHRCSRAEAERRKRTLTADQIEPWMAPLVKDIQLTLHAYESATQTRLRQCWLSGGGAKVREMGDFLAGRLELDPVGPKEGFGADCPRVFSVAFGLAVRMAGPRRKLRLHRPEPDLALNLKQNIAGKPAADADARRDLKLAALGGFVVLALGLADMSIRVSIKESRLRELKTALSGQFQQAFGVPAQAGNELDQARAMLARTDKTLALLGGTGTQTVPTLAELIRRLPKGVSLKVVSLTVEQGTVHLEAETLSFDAVEKVKQALTAAPAFQEVTVSDARVGAAPTQVLFRVTMTVRQP
jgi:general secretion pathway protein L